MNRGIFKKLAVAGIAMLMLIALASGIGQAGGDVNVDIDIDVNGGDDVDINIVTIIYYSNTTIYQAPVTETAKKGQDYLVRDNMFDNPGCVFDGWNTQPHGRGNKYLSKHRHSFNSNIKLYAQWRSDPNCKPNKQRTVTITYNSNYDRGPKAVTDTVVQDKNYTFRNPFTRYGYILESWNTQSNGKGNTYNVGQNVKATNNLTLYAQWKTDPHCKHDKPDKQFTITYNSNYSGGGEVKDTASQRNSYTVYNPSSITRSGYTLVCWTTQRDGSGETYTSGDSFVPKSNLTLYAQWIQDPLPTFTITYNSNYTNGPGEEKDTVDQGKSYQIYNPPSITRSGYTLESWTTNSNGSGNKYKAGDNYVATNNLTLYAQWEKEPQVKITYKSNYVCGPKDVTDFSDKGISYTLKTPFTRACYVLDSWNTQANGSGTKYTVGQTEVLNADLVLYAQWRKYISVKITYCSNYVCGPKAVTDTVEKGSSYTFKNPPTITRSGYTIECWTTNSNGSGTRYTAGQTEVVNGNLILYAKWKK